jgi:hypothetical protein
LAVAKRDPRHKNRKVKNVQSKDDIEQLGEKKEPEP